MLVCGDIHGNLAKALAFIEYKPEERHCFVGDYVDSFKATDDEIVDTLKAVFQSNAVLLSGNHDNAYFRNAGNFTFCSGIRWATRDTFVKIIEENKDKLKACHYEDGYIITHGGIDKYFGEAFDDAEQLVDYCNKEFEKYKNSVLPWEEAPPIFYVGSCRGGRHPYSGVFWASMGYEQFDNRFNVVCGHTHRKEPLKYIQENGTRHVCVDFPQFKCYNTKTHAFEDFMPPICESYRETLEVKF